ncbi:MAG: septum formation initiator family protein [Humidesulfovibrio sp.]|jgi:cell division protein FtsB|uniref:FtsB family cell division protein n=1 Tax=Humidesulfovibrio sp. TaxID=2910988 RepID=UPI00273670EB|nr:septum formation initiator family protein [Humidesulfovibrio sp.]MDP2848045.1 septum formation initiator family protein [Humidesulfovibrio sp.]
MARRILLGVLIAVNVVLLFRLIWSDHGVIAYMNMRNRSVKLENQLRDVDTRSLDLSNEIRRLKMDRAYQEMVIRDRMNYVKENEVLYIFSDRTDVAQGAVDDEKKD